MKKSLIAARCWFVGLVLAVALIGCGPRVDLASLPPIPDLDTSRFAPQITKQIDETMAALKEDPGDKRLNSRLAKMLQTYKQFEAADIMYVRARALDPKEFRLPYLHGFVFRSLGHNEEAIVAFQETLKLKPDFPFAKLRLAETECEMGDLEAAGRIYEQLASMEDLPSEFHFSTGQFLMRQGKAAEAIPHFERAVELSGDFSSAHYQLGMAYRDVGNTQLANKHLFLANEHEGYAADGSDPVTNELLPINLSEIPFVNRAKALVEVGRIEEAEKFIKLALERNPDSVAAQSGLMGLGATKGDFVVVEAAYQRSKELAPDNPKVYYNYGLANSSHQRWSKAKEAFEHSLRLDDQDPNTYVQLALVAKQQGESDASVEQYLRKALEADHSHQTANWLFGELVSVRDPQAAIPCLELASQAPSKFRPLIFLALAKAYVRNGDWQKASQAAEQGRLEALQSDNHLVARSISVFEQAVLSKHDASDNPETSGETKSSPADPSASNPQP